MKHRALHLAAHGHIMLSNQRRILLKCADCARACANKLTPGSQHELCATAGTLSYFIAHFQAREAILRSISKNMSFYSRTQVKSSPWARWCKGTIWVDPDERARLNDLPDKMPNQRQRSKRLRDALHGMWPYKGPTCLSEAIQRL